MISRYTHKGLTWVDLESPTPEEVAAISEEYSLHPLISNELLSTSERAKVDVYDNAVYLILHFPLRNRSTGHISEAEIDFILLKDTVITTHYELIDPLHDFARLFERDSYLSTAHADDHAGFLFFSQIRELYKHTLFLIESVERNIQDIEKQIFSGQETEMVSHLSKTSRMLIDIKSSLRSHKEMIKSFSQLSTRLYGADFANYVSVIEGECGHIEQALEENRQMLIDLRRTNDSLLSTKTNATIRRLTVVNVILMPLNLITFIFAMNSTYLSLNQPSQLLIVLGGMAVIGLISIFYFKSKKWL